MKLRDSGIARSVVILLLAAMSGCDAAKQTAANSLLNPVGKKTFHAPQEWTLSDQSKLSAVVEAVESADGNGGFATMVMTHTPATGQLKSLEFAFAVESNPQAVSAWEPVPAVGTPAAGASAPQTFRQPFSAPEGSKVLFRVQVGEQPEVLSAWVLRFGDE